MTASTARSSKFKSLKCFDCVGYVVSSASSNFASRASSFEPAFEEALWRFCTA